MAVKSWTWDKFYGGESDYQRMMTDSDVTKFQSGTFWIDYRSEPDGIKLLSTQTEYGSYDSNPIAMLDLAEYGSSGKIVCLANGKIYLDGTLKTTITGNKDITSVFVMTYSSTQYVYYVATDTIHRSTINLGTFVEDVVTFDGESSKKFAIRFPTGFFFTGWNHKIFQLDNTQVNTEVLALPDDGYITGFTRFQDQYKIYWTQDGGGKSIEYLWDGFSSTILYSVSFDNLPIYGAVSMGASDYVVTGTTLYSDLYEIQWTTKALRVSNYEGSSNLRQLLPTMYARNDDVFIASKNGVYRYGSYYPGFPRSLGLDFPISNVSDVLFVYVYKETLYVWVQIIWPSYKVYSYNLSTPPTEYVASGEIISMVFDGGSKFSKKTSQEMRIAFDSNATNPKFNRWGNVSIYTRKKPSDSFTLIRTMASDTSDEAVISSSELQAAWIGDWTMIELKLKLERWSTTKSPFVRWLMLTYDENYR